MSGHSALRNADSWGQASFPRAHNTVLLEPCPLCLLLRLRLKGQQLYPQRPLRGMHKPGKSAWVDCPFPTPHLTCLPWQGDLLSHAVDRGAMSMSLERVTCGA